MFKHAIVRPPATSYAQGLTTADFGRPDLSLALQQHSAYCAALERCGLTLTVMEPDPQFPDSTFVEDTAVLTSSSAILTHPGAVSRQGEVPSVGQSLTQFYSSLHTIQPQGHWMAETSARLATIFSLASQRGPTKKVANSWLAF